MRMPIIKLPKNHMRIRRLPQGKAIVSLYAVCQNRKDTSSYRRNYLMANVVETEMPDYPCLEKVIQNNFHYYYSKAIQAEVRFLTKKQYGKVVNRLTAQLMPDKKLKVIEIADYLINAIARGEHELLSPKEMESFLNEYIVYLDNGT